MSAYEYESNGQNVAEILERLNAQARRGRTSQSDKILTDFLNSGNPMVTLRFHGSRDQMKQDRDNTANKLKAALKKQGLKDRIWVKKVEGMVEILILIDLDRVDESVRVMHKQEREFYLGRFTDTNA